MVLVLRVTPLPQDSNNIIQNAKNEMMPWISIALQEYIAGLQKSVDKKVGGD